MSAPASRRGPIALVLLLLLGVVGVWLWSDAEGSSEPEAPAGISLRPKVGLDVEGARPEIEGRLLLEAELEDPLGDPTLEPASVCTVRVWQEGALVGEPVPCQAGGHFVAPLRAGESGQVSVELEAPGRLRAVVTVEIAEDGRGVLPDVAVGHGVTVEGQVVNLRGEAVGGVVVEARPVPDLGEPEPWRRTTDAQGRFVFDTLPPGPIALRCDAAGYAPTVVEAIAPQNDVVLRMGGLYDVRGRVLAAGTDADVAAAQVRLEGSGVWPARVVDVEPDGSFVVPGVPDGVYALEAVLDGDGGPSFASVPLEGVEPDLEVSLALVPATWVPLEVQDPSGAPVRGARVTVMNAQVGLLSRRGVTDEEGRTRVGPVVPGPYVARADADGWLASAPEAVQVEEEAPAPVLLRLERPGRLVVTVVDPRGDGVSGAAVALRSDALYSVGEAQARAETFARTVRAAGTLGVTPGPVPAVPRGEDDPTTAWRRSSAGGAVAFQGLVPGTYTVTASHPDHAGSAERTVTLRAGGQAEVTVMLREGQPLTGRVRDENARPIEGAQVRVDDVLVARTDDRGVFDAGPHAGKVRVEVRGLGYAARSEVVRLTKDPVDLEWTLQDADGVLSGQVVAGNDRPVEGARVSIHPRGGRSETVWTDAKGTYAFDGLPRGRAELVVEHGDFVPHTAALTVARETALDVTLLPGWQTTLVVRWQGSLEPALGARVRGGGVDVRVDARGDAELRGLGRDRVRVEVSAAGAPAVRRSLRRTDAEGETVFVELVEGGALHGRVTDYRGDPVPGAEVEVRLPGSDEALGTTRASARGRYRFEGLPEGDVVLQAWPSDARDADLDTEVLRSDIRRGHVTQDVVFKLPRR